LASNRASQQNAVKALNNPASGSSEHSLENAPPSPSTRQEELRSFLFFTVVMAPVLAVLIVGGYGFLVWMYQVLAGPPGA
jgi:nitrate reductase NapE